MYNPVSTYRIQFHKDFNFTAFESIIPYLQSLGVKTIYASPIFESTPGSTHGYDALNSNSVNPEIGNEEKLRELSKKLKQHNIGWLQDIVPNHMAFDTRNPWVMDLLEKGPQSIYAHFFDITWTSNLHQGRIMVPFLGSSLEEVIKKGELKLSYEAHKFVFHYYEAIYPLHPSSYATILNVNKGPQAIQQLLQQMQGIKQVEDRKAYAEEWNEFLMQLAGLMRNKIVRRSIDEALELFNNDREKLLELANEQAYRLCHWQETDSQINYRRFFTVNGLICLNIHDTEVMDEHHRLIQSLVDEGILSGLRIDHIDGLYNPTQYLGQLRQKMGDDTYVIVEKILGPGESLPKHWPVQGNTGYDFLSLVNNLLTQKSSEEPFTQFYYALVNDHRSVPQQVRDKKAHILYHHMGGELENLYQLFMESALVSQEDYAQMRTEDIKTAIAEFLIHCPVYRYYGNDLPLSDEELKPIQTVLQQAKVSRPDLLMAFDLLEKVILYRPQQADDDYNKRALHFYQRCMQFTGPLMAKGVEDTLMYTFNRFIGHNEVGDSPEAFGITPKEFHHAMIERQKYWPLSLNATATHDTKRGEDIRARLNVLTDLPGEWLKAVEKWQKLNAGLKQNGAPDANDEYFIYQTLVGTYPMAGDNIQEYSERLQKYLQKALREAKRHSNWTSPNETYESETKSFAVGLLDKSKPLWKSFENFQQKIMDFGIVNSLAQSVLKFTCPGVPDVYQGCELWDLSFVDPDNRRPVNYAERQAVLEEINSKKEKPELLQDLWDNRHNAGIKLWLTQELFELRKQYPSLFTNGDYIPVKIEGRYKNNVFAYARKHQHKWFVIAIPLHTAQLCTKQGKEILDIDWDDTKIILPKGVDKDWEHVFLNKKDTHEKEILVQHLFQKLPFSILKGRQVINERRAGILLHITSLPSAFGIGDLGPEAYAFADFLSRSNQRYWQLLPLNPIEEGQAHSPYSSISSRAGNVLFISPEGLVRIGLLQPEDLAPYYLPQEGKARYGDAERIKKELFDKAFSNYKSGLFELMQIEFQQFREKEKAWLNDFALYLVLKQKNSGKPWYEWEEAYKLRNETALQKLAKESVEEIEKVEWIQFLFAGQWKDLKTYCNELGIELIGDLPIYVSYDSADVWANRELFCLDDKGARTGLAGVPPDAFSEDGQLWGMPVYRWDVLEQRGYDWWVDRLKKNSELFDSVRLDHFRAFADYWEVPAGEATAKNGQWKLGPGAHFFETIKTALGELPFVAEDLGEINDAVVKLRDQFQLPGMKILQFAFDESMPGSEYIPHNYTKNFIVYTGTHDNNTVRGWYRDEADNETKIRLQQYVGRALTEDDIPHVLCRMAYASVANVVILPMQDILGLDGLARMNTPASGQNNWAWRLLPGQITTEAENNLIQWTAIYNRE